MQDGGWLALGSGGVILRGAFDPEAMTTPAWSVLAECPLSSPVMFNATNGAVLQCVAGSFPILSTDSGFFWQVTDRNYYSYTGMHFPSSDTGYLFGTGMRTTDSGHTWKSFTMVPSSSVSNIVFSSADTGFGLSGVVVRTTDGGANWQKDTIMFPNSPYAGYTVMSNTLTGLSSPDGMHAFTTYRSVDTLIVPMGKHWWDYSRTRIGVYKTSDGGVTWQELQNVAAPGTIRGMYFRTASLGFLLSDSGRIYRTSNGGNDWTLEQVAPAQYTFNSIKFRDDRIGFLTIDTEAVLASTDGGVNWSWLPVPTNREEIALRQDIFIMPPDTIHNLSGMNTEGIFFPDSTTVLIAFDRALYNINIPPQISVSNGDTFVVFNPSTDMGVHESDYGFYRGKLNIPPPSAVRESPVPSGDGLAISLYPNPARDEMRVAIASPLTQNARVEVLNMLGASVLTRSNVGDNVSLDLRSLPSGVYMLRCSTGSLSGMKIFTIAR